MNLNENILLMCRTQMVAGILSSGLEARSWGETEWKTRGNGLQKS